MLANLDTNAYIYDFLRSWVSPHLCWLHPNYITLMRVVPFWLSHKGFLQRKPAFLGWLLVSVFMDHLDGSVARTCKTTSKLGSWLDSLADLIQFSALLYYLMYPRLTMKASLVLICGISVLYMQVCGNSFDDHVSDHPVHKLLFDNLIIVMMLIGLAVYKRQF